MPCPCCLGALVPAFLGAPSPAARLGDLWCERCRWLLAAEMIGDEGPLALDGVLRCPTHARPPDPDRSEPR
jgi:hypothetical protein